MNTSQHTGAPQLPETFYKLEQEGILSLAGEDSRLLYPRFVLPNFSKLLADGCRYLDIAPPKNLTQALDALLIFYTHLPSHSGYPVYLGKLDTLLNPFSKGMNLRNTAEVIEQFLGRVARIFPSTEVRYTVGPQDSWIGRTLLAIERGRNQPTPTISFLYDDSTPEDFGREAVRLMLDTGKLAFVRADEENRVAAGRHYLLPQGGGVSTAVGVDLCRMTARTQTPDNFFRRLPEILETAVKAAEIRSAALLDGQAFHSHFLVQEGLTDSAAFSPILEIDGLLDSSLQLAQGRGEGVTFQSLNREVTAICIALSGCVQGRGAKIHLRGDDNLAHLVQAAQDIGLKECLTLCAAAQTCADAGAMCALPVRAGSSPAAVLHTVGNVFEAGGQGIILYSGSAGLTYKNGALFSHEHNRGTVWENALD